MKNEFKHLAIPELASDENNQMTGGFIELNAEEMSNVLGGDEEKGNGECSGNGICAGNDTCKGNSKTCVNNGACVVVHLPEEKEI